MLDRTKSIGYHLIKMKTHSFPLSPEYNRGTQQMFWFAENLDCPRASRTQQAKRRGRFSVERPLGPRGQVLMFAPVGVKPWKEIRRWVDSKHHVTRPTKRDLVTGRARIERVVAKPKYRIGDWYRIYDSFFTFALRDAEVTVILKDLKVIKILRAWGSDNPIVHTEKFTPHPGGSYEMYRIEAEKAFGEAIHALAIRRAQENGELPSAEKEEVINLRKRPVRKEKAPTIPTFYRMEGPYSSDELAATIKKWTPMILQHVRRVAKPGEAEFSDLKSELEMKIVSLVQGNGIRAEEARAQRGMMKTHPATSWHGFARESVLLLTPGRAC